MIFKKNKVACIEKENEMLKNENVSLISKLNDLYEGNTTLKIKLFWWKNKRKLFCMKTPL